MRAFTEERVTITSLDGIKLDGVLALTGAENPKGNFMLLHGCPSYMDEYGFYSGEPNEQMPHGGMSEFLATHGYNVFRFNYRSQSKDMTEEQMGDISVSGMIADTESAYQYMMRVLPKHLPMYVVATSFSGGISIQWINSFERKVDYLFLMCPLLNMKHTLRRTNAICKNEYGIEVLTNEIVSDLEKKGFTYSGDRKMNYAFFDELLTINIRREFSLLKMPNAVFHGTIDPSCRYEDSKEYVEKYSNGKSILYTYENARHGFGGPKDEHGNSDITIKRCNQQDIFEKVLKCIENDYN